MLNIQNHDNHIAEEFPDLLKEGCMTNYDHLYNTDYYKTLLSKGSFSEIKLRWKVIHNGTVFPFTGLQDDQLGGLLDEHGEYIDGSGVHRGMGTGRDIRDEEIEIFDEEVVFLGVWPGVWGHCLTDNIRRLWVLNNKDFMKEHGNKRFLYVPFQNIEPGDSFRELLEILGASDIRLEAVRHASRFKKVILPDECFWSEPDGTRVFTSEYRELIDSIREFGMQNYTPGNIKKLYFTYSRHPAMRTIGERKLERFFSSMGYTIVSPEKYSFKEQLGMLLGCEEFACTVGSASHNSIFLRDGTKVTLIPRAGFISEYQPALDQIHELDITYADSSLSLYVKPDRPWEGPFYYIVSDQLRECFGQTGRYRGNKQDFGIYRALAYVMNGYTEPAEYYKDVVGGYLSADYEWDGKRSIAVKLLCHSRLRSLITEMMG